MLYKNKKPFLILDTRKRALFATNIDKTIDAIQVPDLVKFGGLAGRNCEKNE